mmetsp:Transcript_25282/g.79357  ORF Transcript_25282/g.79357 Transcript_25282/m.79357 type:complete len:333 (-) Transcript_25282:84-1082(-)
MSAGGDAGPVLLRAVEALAPIANAEATTRLLLTQSNATQLSGLGCSTLRVAYLVAAGATEVRAEAANAACELVAKGLVPLLDLEGGHAPNPLALQARAELYAAALRVVRVVLCDRWRSLFSSARTLDTPEAESKFSIFMEMLLLPLAGAGALRSGMTLAQVLRAQKPQAAQGGAPPAGGGDAAGGVFQCEWSPDVVRYCMNVMLLVHQRQRLFSTVDFANTFAAKFLQAAISAYVLETLPTLQEEVVAFAYGVAKEAEAVGQSSATAALRNALVGVCSSAGLAPADVQALLNGWPQDAVRALESSSFRRAVENFAHDLRLRVDDLDGSVLAQ